MAKHGGIGVISAAHPGYMEDDFEKYLEANLRGLHKHIKRPRNQLKWNNW